MASALLFLISLHYIFFYATFSSCKAHRNKTDPNKWMSFFCASSRKVLPLYCLSILPGTESVSTFNCRKHLAIASMLFETISGNVYMYMNMPSCQIAEDACWGGDSHICGQEIKVSSGACAPLHLHVSPCTIHFCGRILLIYFIPILWYFKSC